MVNQYTMYCRAEGGECRMYETVDTLKEIEKQYNFLSKDIDMSKAKFSLMCRCITAEIKHGETKYHNNVKHGYANSLQAIQHCTKSADEALSKFL